jgi:hypothetical protein
MIIPVRTARINRLDRGDFEVTGTFLEVPVT